MKGSKPCIKLGSSTGSTEDIYLFEAEKGFSGHPFYCRFGCVVSCLGIHYFFQKVEKMSQNSNSIKVDISFTSFNYVMMLIADFECRIVKKRLYTLKKVKGLLTRILWVLL